MIASGIQEPAIAQVKQWLLARKPEVADIDDDLDLIENRLIDSLSFLDFVYFLESVCGRELTATAETVDSFRTLRSIQGRILDAGA